MSDTFKSLEGYEGLSPVDKFGKFLMQHLRDAAIEDYEFLAAGYWKAPRVQELQQRLQSLSDEQLLLVRDCVLDAIDTGIGQFLFKLQEQADFENSFRVLVDGTDIIATTEALHWGPYDEDGWIAKFSKYETKL